MTVAGPKPHPEKRHDHASLSAPELLEGVERALAELRRGSAVVILCDTEAALVRAAETIDSGPLALFSRPEIGDKSLVVTGRRAAILGLSDLNVRAVILMGLSDWTQQHIEPLINPEAQGPVPPHGVKASAAVAGSVADASVRLIKMARLLPAALCAPIAIEDASAWAQANGRWVITEDLRIVSEARVPLADAENTRIVSFRSRDGGAEHLAIIVGSLDISQPVLTRLHSECFTGDLLGSLRCDCGQKVPTG